ncbi:MAG TPA: Ig-like domain-containing protein [Gemmatimonadales bacterium]|nr:Ig-like domain-containing protein [Gemmatimonadales bacterium]
MLALAGLGACLDDSIVQQSTTLPPSSGLIISNPVPNAAPSAMARVGSARTGEGGGDVVYVSLIPGTAPTGTLATVQRVGDTVSLTTALVGGGFDPVPVTAQTGDSIEVSVRDAAGNVVFYSRAAVAAVRPPVVVRTDPPPRKRDVPLNASMVIVFSEPVDSNTLTASSVRLLRGATAVAGTVKLLAGTATDAILTPDAPLGANADYRLIVMQSVTDLDGNPLAAPDTVGFTTEQAGGPPAQLQFTIPPTNTFIGRAIEPVVQITALDANGNTANGFGGTVSVALGPGNGTASLAGTTTTTAVAGVAKFPNLSIDQAGIGYTLTGIADGLPATTSETFEVVIPALGQITFMSAPGGHYEILATNADGSGQVNLSNDSANDMEAVWEPNGSRVVFSSARDGNWEIYVGNAVGSGLVNLTNNPAPDYLAAWSPDGGRIAFTSERDGNAEIYVMSANGSGLVNLTNNPAFDYEAAWSPDGKKIAFVSLRDNGNREIYVMNADGSGVIRLTSDTMFVNRPVWSPDGALIAFERHLGPCHSVRCPHLRNIYVVGADGSGLRNLTNTPAIDNAGAAWSPDGSKIALYTNRDAYYEIYAMNADGSGITRLTNDALYDTDPAWSPDGSKIAFVINYSNLSVMNADGSEQVNISSYPGVGVYSPSWRPR